MTALAAAICGWPVWCAQTAAPGERCAASDAANRTFAAAAHAVTVSAPRGRIGLAVVADEPSRERGLMCVTRVPAGRGMIFVFPPPDASREFWMKDTLIPLDMVFVSGEGRVTRVAAGVPATVPGTPDEAVARRRGEARYVIELAAGDAARFGIRPGLRLALPALSAKE